MKSNEVDAYLQAALNSEAQGDYRSSISLFWIAVRRSIFSFLDFRGVAYTSTETAVFQFLQLCSDRQTAESVIELYHVSIFVEFDEYDFSEGTYVFRCVAAAKDVLLWFKHRLPIKNNIKVKLFEAMRDHLEDCKWSKEGHFYAADVFEKRNSYCVTYPLVFFTVLTFALGLDLLKTFIDALGLDVVGIHVLTQVVAFLGLALSLLNASINWSLRSQRHRTTANKYIRLYRDVKHLQLELHSVPADELVTELMLHKVNAIKIELNNAAEEAPPIPGWAYEHARRVIVGPKKPSGNSDEAGEAKNKKPPGLVRRLFTCFTKRA